jgi:hypothetical protein
LPPSVNVAIGWGRELQRANWASEAFLFIMIV